jgi:dinuclear metal center YbgI/SA1388 family protein
MWKPREATMEGSGPEGAGAGGAYLESVLQFLDDTLEVPGFPDYDGAWNGLQVGVADPRTHRVTRVAAAVDATEASVRKAAEWEADLLLVHHGLFWGRARTLTGPEYRKVAPLIQGGTALYSAHLPLDAHPELGNAVRLIRALGLEPVGRFGRFEDRDIGFEVRIDESVEAFRDRIAAALGGPVRVVPGGPGPIRRVGVVTGSAGSLIPDAAAAGLDALLTGEATHHHALAAMEAGLHLILAGHYATETWGVRALAGRLAEEFGVTWEFLDLPTGF